MKAAMILLAMSLSASVSAQTQSMDNVSPKATTPTVPNVISSPNDVQAYSATTIGGPLWVRPDQDGTCCSDPLPVALHVRQFTVSADDTCNVRSIQDGWDGILFIYAPSFDPLNQTVNFLVGDDDGAGGIGTSDIDGIALTAGVTYQIVTTGYSGADGGGKGGGGGPDEGAFTNTITCPVANVSIAAGVPAAPTVALPTMGQNALLALSFMIGLMGFVAIRRRA